MTKRDALVFIGRFQPFHMGHAQVIMQALDRAKEVVVIIGSAYNARDSKNPFTFEERKELIEAAFLNNPNLHVVPVSDYPYSDAKWIRAVQAAVDNAVPHAKDVGLIGHSKDSSSYYLKIFPKWKNHVEVGNVDNINATDLRKTYFEGGIAATATQHVPHITLKWLARFEDSEEYARICEEHRMMVEYKKKWEVAPFPPIFVTVDAVVVQSGHVLLVKRGHMPGAGLMAIPGGFLNPDEFIEQAAIRELKEETKIKVPVPVLHGSIKQNRVFDRPNRSLRGRTITHAFLIDLGNDDVLPKVKGSDDAVHAAWVPLGQIRQDQMFEDHAHIIAHFLGFDWE
jgi:bifunctional NMN adenylyltransferase/nudix hydrolase